MDAMKASEHSNLLKLYCERINEMTARDEELLRLRLNPNPKNIVFDDTDDFFRFNKESVFNICTAETADTEHIGRIFNLFWGFIPVLNFLRDTQDGNSSVSADEYQIKVSAEHVDIQAHNVGGILDSLKTLRQLAEVERGKRITSAYELPLCTISDYPSTTFRGIHICWFPENHIWQIERAIRLAAYYKFNYVVLETWGVFPFDCAPFLCWPGKGIPKEELKRIITSANELGLTIIPQFNLMGHASGSRENGGKHVTLNTHPEYASLFEPDGWSWCLSNPETRKVLSDCVVEMHDFFNKPPYFHIGCDEARLFCSCRTCRKVGVHKLVRDHLLHFHSLLKERNAQPIMWHDMLLQKEDPRWNGYIVCGTRKDGLESLLDELPKDFIIDDWQYGYPEKDGNPPDWSTSRFFKEKGFQVFVSPAGNLKGLKSLAELVANAPLEGILQTTWSDLDKGMLTTFYKAAQAIWHGGQIPEKDTEFSFEWAPNAMCEMHHHLRQVENEMNIRDYLASGRIMLQLQDKICF